MEKNPNVGKFVIAEAPNCQDFFKEEDSNQVIFFNTLYDAQLTCGMYEFHNAFILQIIENYQEPPEPSF